MRSTQRISGSEHSEFGRWFELLFMLLLKVLFIVAPLTLLLLFCSDRQPSSCFSSAHVASLSLSDSGVSRDTDVFGVRKGIKKESFWGKNWLCVDWNLLILNRRTAWKNLFLFFFYLLSWRWWTQTFFYPLFCKFCLPKYRNVNI